MGFIGAGRGLLRDRAHAGEIDDAGPRRRIHPGVTGCVAGGVHTARSSCCPAPQRRAARQSIRSPVGPTAGPPAPGRRLPLGRAPVAEGKKSCSGRRLLGLHRPEVSPTAGAVEPSHAISAKRPTRSAWSRRTPSTQRSVPGAASGRRSWLPCAPPPPRSTGASLGLGEDLRLQTGAVEACALAEKGELVHLRAFPNTGEVPEEGPEDRIAD